MAIYIIPREFKIEEYPFELRNAVGRFLNTNVGKYTIPQIAQKMQADENKVAWVLSNLCELTTPEVIVDTLKGKDYWENAFKLKNKAPHGFDETTVFFGRTMK